MLAIRAHDKVLKRQMRMLAAVVTCPTITAWMPKGKRCRVEDIIAPDYHRPTTAAGVRRYMAKHIAGLEGRD